MWNMRPYHPCTGFHLDLQLGRPLSAMRFYSYVAMQATSCSTILEPLPKLKRNAWPDLPFGKGRPSKLSYWREDQKTEHWTSITLIVQKLPLPGFQTAFPKPKTP